MAVHAENRKARFDFEILEAFEAGIELFGLEVKSIKANKISLEGSYVFPRMGALWLVGATIAPYQPNNTPEDYDQMRERKLLLHKKEIDYLLGKFSTKGLTILPMRVYDKGPRVKIEIAVTHKRKIHDKRERTRERETDRTISRTLKEI
jgi:SsrA-binding protein